MGFPHPAPAQTQPHLCAILSSLFTRRGPGDQSPQLLPVAGKHSGPHFPLELFSEHWQVAPLLPLFLSLGSGKPLSLTTLQMETGGALSQKSGTQHE